MPIGTRIGPHTKYRHPRWAKDFGSREHVLPGGVKVDANQFTRSNAVDVTINATGAVAANEVQRVTITGVPTGGAIKLLFDGAQTADIAYNATAAVVQAALEALGNVNVGDVTVGGGPGPAAFWTVTFGGQYANTNVPAMTATSTLTGGTTPAVAVTTTTGGTGGPSAPAGSTTLPVDATSGAIPAGTVLRFMPGGYLANVTVDAAAGATALTVDPIGFDIPDNAAAQYRGTGQVYIRSGTVIGRTYAERDAKTPFGPAADADDEVFLLFHDIDDALDNNDGDVYRPGGLVAENFLPVFSTLSSTLKGKLRAAYQCMIGAD